MRTKLGRVLLGFGLGVASLAALGPSPVQATDASAFALVSTSSSSVDNVGGVDTPTPGPDGAIPLGFTSAQLTNNDEAAGTAINASGSVGLVATLDTFLDVVSPPEAGSAVTTADLSGLSQVTGSQIETSGVALTPDGSEGLVAVGGDGVGVIAPENGSWGLHTNGSIFAISPSHTGSYEGVVISPTRGSDGQYVGLAMDGSHSTIGVITGVGGVSPQFVGSVSDPSIQDTGSAGYQDTDDFGNGGMAFSPTTATRAVTVTVNGVAVVSLADPTNPALTTAVTVPGAAPGGAQSVVVAPDGDHVIFAVNKTLYFYTGLATADATDPLSPSAPPMTMPGLVNALAVSASGYLDVNYDVGSSGAALGVVGGIESGAPSLSASSVSVSGQAPDVNGMAVWPAEVASSAPSPTLPGANGGTGGGGSNGGSGNGTSGGSSGGKSGGSGGKGGTGNGSSGSGSGSNGRGRRHQHCQSVPSGRIPYQDLFWILDPSRQLLALSCT